MFSKIAKHGITKNTPSNIPLGAGVWLKNFVYNAETGWSGTPLGATSGGCSLKITPEILDIEIDGALAPAKGLAVMSGGTGEAEVNFAEVNKDILKMTMLGEEAEEDSLHCIEGFDCIQTKSAITEGDYVENLAFVGYTADKSKQIVAIMENALCTSGLQFDAKNKENTVIKATLKAYGNIDTDLDKVPIRVYYPKEAATE